MKRIILISGLLIGVLSISAQIESNKTSKEQIALLNSEYKKRARAIRKDYDEKRKLAIDAQQDDLEKAYWKNRLRLKREKRRIKKSLKVDPYFTYQFSKSDPLELDPVETHIDLLEVENTIAVESVSKALSMNSSLVEGAQEHIGVPYRYGGTDERGFDCSGFVQHIFGKAGHELPRTSEEQANFGEKISLSKVRPGDLVFFANRGSKIDHVGIVTKSNDGKLEMIHSSTSKGIIITDVMSSSYWKPRLKKARRIS